MHSLRQKEKGSSRERRRERTGDLMKKTLLISILLLASLGLPGCGTQDRNQQGMAQLAEAAQDKPQETGLGRLAENAGVRQKEAQVAQTDWDGREGSPQVESAEADSNDAYKAGLFGVDSSEMLSCTVYHGESCEEIDLTEARGKCLIQMLDEFFRDPKYTYGMLEGGYFQEEIEDLGRMASSIQNDYFIYIELGKRITHALQGETLKNFNTVMIETYSPSSGCGVILNYNIENDDYFYPASGMEPGMREDFLSRYRDWEQTEDWDAAVEELKERQE